MVFDGRVRSRVPRSSSRSSQSADDQPQQGVRLQRLLAEAGVASRRACEELIEQGEVSVNGEIRTELPIFVDPKRDRVVVQGRVVELTAPTRKQARRARNPDDNALARGPRVYVMVHKPERVLVTTADQAEEVAPNQKARGNRRAITDLVEHPSGARLYPIGRLDFLMTGLVLLTNDGQLAHRLTHASFEIPRLYRAEVRGSITQDALNTLQRRVCPTPSAEELDSFAAQQPEGNDVAAKSGRPGGGGRGAWRERPMIQGTPGVVIAHAGDDKVTLDITVRSQRAKLLQEILLQLGLDIRKLTCIGIGPLTMDHLKVGGWRDLTPEEVTTLKQAVGLTKADTGEAPRTPGIKKPRRAPTGAKPSNRPLQGKKPFKKTSRKAGPKGGPAPRTTSAAARPKKKSTRSGR